MIYRDFPIEQARPLFEELKTAPPSKDVIPKVVVRPIIKIE